MGLGSFSIIPEFLVLTFPAARVVGKKASGLM
jgi:hypothetical protein